MLALLRRAKGRAWVMKRVLLPIDGSECSLRAVKYLLDQRADRSNPSDPEIHLVNVQVPLSGHIGQFIKREQIAGFQHDEGVMALQGARALLDAGGMRYTVHTEVGWTAEVIMRLADSLHCDHIVMGTHGRRALTELLIGSTTLKVLHLTHVPVVLVK
jgi:nucleotide-binding universal stress UspA family protein